MKYISIFLLAILSFSASAYNEDDLLMEIRGNLKLATENEKICENLYAKVKDLKNTSPLLKGYIGAVTIAKSKHVPLLDKLSTFNKGTAILDEAIKADPKETELRFLRLTLQLNLPGFLGYRDNIAADKEFIFSNFGVAQSVLQKKIADFVNTSGHFSEKEKGRVRI